MILKAGPFRQNVDYQMLISDDTLLALGDAIGERVWILSHKSFSRYYASAPEGPIQRKRRTFLISFNSQTNMTFPQNVFAGNNTLCEAP